MSSSGVCCQSGTNEADSLIDFPPIVGTRRSLLLVIFALRDTQSERLSSEILCWFSFTFCSCAVMFLLIRLASKILLFTTTGAPEHPETSEVWAKQEAFFVLDLVLIVLLKCQTQTKVTVMSLSLWENSVRSESSHQLRLTLLPNILQTLMSLWWLSPNKSWKQKLESHGCHAS